MTKEQKQSRDERAAFPDIEHLAVLCLVCHVKTHGLTIRGFDPDREFEERNQWRDFIGELEHASVS